MMEKIAKTFYRPVNNSPDISVRIHKTPCIRVVKVGLVSVMDFLWNSGVIHMMKLPNVAFRVKDGDFPVQVTVRVTGIIVFDINHLPTGACVNWHTMRGCDHINTVVKISIDGILIIILIRTNQVTHLRELMGPGVG